MENVYAFKGNPIKNNCCDPFLFNFKVHDLANGKHAPRLRDIWIPGSF
jgi:hypothetical protein